MQTQDLLSAADELDCALLTMRLAEDGEELNEELRRMVVFPGEVGARRHELEGQVTLYKSELQASKSQLQYLRNLAVVSVNPLMNKVMYSVMVAISAHSIVVLILHGNRAKRLVL